MNINNADRYLKVFFAVFYLALLMVLLTGCGKTVLFDVSRVINETGFQMEYTVLNQLETADLILSEGDQLQVVLAHTGGNVDIAVGQDGKEPIYRGTSQENAEFSLTIPETGVYRISVTGHQARGNVLFTRIPGD